MKILLISLLTCAYCSIFAQTKQEIVYDFSCLDTDAASNLTSFFGDLEKEMLTNFGVSVSIQDEEKVGQLIFDECKTNFTFIENGPELKNLKDILKKLVNQIDKPKGFKYNIYLLDTTMLNAFTAGGNIFFTTEMYRFCKSNDELASIISHEIFHNELGHISEQIKREKTANSYFGEDIGKMSSFVGTILTTPFNQKNETHCDLAGTDLMKKAAIKPCSTTKLWRRMQENEGEYKQLNSIFSSHPYSGKRATCISNHLKINYTIICE